MKLTYPIIKDILLVVVIAYFVFGGSRTRTNIKSLKQDIKTFETDIKDLKDEIITYEQIVRDHCDRTIDSTAADDIITRHERSMSESER